MKSTPTIKVQVYEHKWGGKTYLTLVVNGRRVAGLKMLNAKLKHEFVAYGRDLLEALEPQLQEAE